MNTNEIHPYKVSVLTKVTFTPDMIEDWLRWCVESCSTYWCELNAKASTWGDDEKDPIRNIAEGRGWLVVTLKDPETFPGHHERHANAYSLLQTLEALAQRDRRLFDLLATENYDGIAADHAFQYLMLGEVYYA